MLSWKEAGNSQKTRKRERTNGWQGTRLAIRKLVQVTNTAALPPPCNNDFLCVAIQMVKEESPGSDGHPSQPMM